MLRISELETITDKNNIQETIPKLMKKIHPILEKRRKLHKIYSRGGNESKVMFSENKDKTVVSYEKFLTDISSGYLSGAPVYTVDCIMDEKKKEVLEKIFDKELGDEEYKNQMEMIIKYIANYNDDITENYDLIHNILEMTACYEILYENEDNEMVYSKYSPLDTVAIWDYSIPANLLAIVRMWEEKNINDKTISKVEITDKYGTKTYSVTENYKEVKEEDNDNHDWGDVPAIVVEVDFAIFESCEDEIKAYEQLIQNIRNTFQYNDSDCKLHFSGYVPENQLIISEIVVDKETNEEKEIFRENPARIKEDELLMKAKTIYTQENGDAEWLTKPLDSNGAVEILKIYTNLMFQLAGIPNTSDLAFNSADLNASAIDRKFYIMNMMTASVIAQLKKAYLRRWELIFGRINLKNDTNYDFRDIRIELPKNLPANDDERIDSMLKLQGTISNQTIIESIGYDYLAEKTKMDNESEDNMLKNIERMSLLEQNGADIEETTIQEQTGKEEIKKAKTDDEIMKDIEEDKSKKKEEK